MRATVLDGLVWAHRESLVPIYWAFSYGSNLIAQTLIAQTLIAQT